MLTSSNDAQSCVALLEQSSSTSFTCFVNFGCLHGCWWLHSVDVFVSLNPKLWKLRLGNERLRLGRKFQRVVTVTVWCGQNKIFGNSSILHFATAVKVIGNRSSSPRTYSSTRYIQQSSVFIESLAAATSFHSEAKAKNSFEEGTPGKRKQ